MTVQEFWLRVGMVMGSLHNENIRSHLRLNEYSDEDLQRLLAELKKLSEIAYKRGRGSFL
jgi:hypothetical protein